MQTHPHQSTQHMPMSEHDPIVKFRALVPRLKESLSKLMDVAAIVFYQNSQSDNCMRPGEAFGERFDKCLEEFYAICDQMEWFLRLSLECLGSNADSHKFTPQPVLVASTQQPPPPNTLSFSQYLHTVKNQISSARQVHDMLLECSRKLNTMPTGAPTMAQQGTVGQGMAQQGSQPLTGQSQQQQLAK